MLIKFILQRPSHMDSSYGSGLWVQGQVKDVPDAIAVKLLRHKDCFEETNGESVDAEKVDLPVADKEKEDAAMTKELLIMDIQRMDKEQLMQYSENSLHGIKMDGRLSVEKMRATVINNLEQFGTL